MAKFGDILTTDVVDTSGFTGSWNPPACKLVRAQSATVAVGTPLSLTFDSTTGIEECKTVAAMHSTSTNTNRIVATQLGLFLVKTQVSFSGGTTGAVISTFIDVTVPSASQTTTYEVRTASGYATASYHVRPILVDVDPNTYVALRLAVATGTSVTATTETWLSFRCVAAF